MPSEFVVLDNDIESDWIDPVKDVLETKEFWYVDNGHAVYPIKKIPGRTVIERRI